MVRGRHVRRAGLEVWLSPGPPQPPWRTVHALSLVLLSDRVRELDDEVVRLRSAQRAGAAAAVLADLRAQRMEGALSQTRGELDALRSEMAELREELVWAFAERRLPEDRGNVVDLPRSVGGTG
jgi:hypothetical protein